MGVVTLIREAAHGIQACVSGRKNRPGVECNTPICRIERGRLIVRCRNCGTDHVYESRDGSLALVESRVRTRALPQSSSIR